MTCVSETLQLSAPEICLTQIRSSKWKGIWPQIIKAFEAFREVSDSKSPVDRSWWYLPLKNVVCGQLPCFNFTLEQKYFVLFRHHQSIFVPSMVALQMGTFRCKTRLKGSARQRSRKVFGNDTVSSYIPTLLQTVPPTDKRKQIVTYKHLSTSITKIEANKTHRFEGGTSNCLQLISYVFLPIWTIIRELSEA
jgi:hypothetical protein